MKNLILRLFLLGFFIISISSCSSSEKPQAEVSNLSSPTATTNATATNVVARTDKIKFKTADGSELFSLKQDADGAKLVDGKNQELVKIKAEPSGKIKLKTAGDKVLGYIVTEKGSWKLENPAQNKELYILKRQNDSSYKLEDAAGKEIYQIQARDNGWEIATPDKKLVYQVKVKEDKISLRNPSSKTVFSTKSGISTIAFACFGLDVLTREQQAALAYAVNLTGGR